jgi:hypothetical protein
MRRAVGEDGARVQPDPDPVAEDDVLVHPGVEAPLLVVAEHELVSLDALERPRWEADATARAMRHGLG